MRIIYIKQFCEAVKSCKEELGWSEMKIYSVLTAAEITPTDLCYAEEPELEALMRKGVKYIPVEGEPKSVKPCWIMAGD